MDRAHDVIAAIATGAGTAAIGVVRLSGAGSHDVAARLCPGLPRPFEDRRLSRARLSDPADGRPLDDAMVVFFREGASYTGEESAELHCHGGPAVLRGVLDACLRAGARPAAPGEFTRRALAAGRMDLVQAEAVALLAEAGGADAVAFSLDALSGRPSAEVVALADRLADALADCETALDVADDAGLAPDLDAVRDAIADGVAATGSWLDAARAARPSLASFRVALAGAPNAGKSSLFNALLGRPRAIVHHEPGTTRDVVGEAASLAGARCLLLDTAGIRAPAGPVEAEGVARARAAAADADCVVLVVDGRDPGSAPDGDPGFRPPLVALTKADLWSSAPAFDPPEGARVFATSAVDGRGIPELAGAIGALASQAATGGRVAGCVIAGDRQERAVSDARAMLARAADGLATDAPLEVVAADLRAAIGRLLEVTGRAVAEDVLDRVFRRFCVGK
ncbi:MAG: 50S ribosome-binding GTPase [Deltaproteobacteria bacterium]|nr:50S ribosome-binding GTPase [Deltaproteobacteria bacterium]